MARVKSISLKFKIEFVEKWKENKSLRRRIEQHKFVERCTDVSLVLKRNVEPYQLNLLLDLLSQYGFTPNMYKMDRLEADGLQKLEKTFLLKLRDKAYYNNLDMGPDVAEDEPDLNKYFIRTQSYYSVIEGEKRLVVGAKGSGKSAIKKMIYENNPDHCIQVTPEHYATGMLDEVLGRAAAIGSKEGAFATAWKYTLLIELFKKIVESKRALRTGPYVPLHEFLRDNHEVVELDLFSRFVRYIKRIQGIKLGEYEVSVKTRELRKLFSLEKVYQLIPSMEKILKHPFYILIDELDQGWDNSENSNNFIIGLFLAANQLSSYHKLLQCCVFIRGEIFDLVSRSYGHLDKLRHPTELLSWNDESLVDMLCRRIAVSMGMYVWPEARGIIRQLFDHKSFKKEIGEVPLRYILNRTCMRPRELIQFVRLAHRQSVEHRLISIDANSVKTAEGIFSKHKAEHLYSEYKEIIPGLRDVVEAFRFHKRVWSFDELELFCIKLIIASYTAGKPDWLMRCEPEHLIQRLYDIEFIGIPNDSKAKYYGYCYSFDRPNVYIRDYSEFQVHPGYWKYLNLES